MEGAMATSENRYLAAHSSAVPTGHLVGQPLDAVMEGDLSEFQTWEG
jgi:hypothetical protein